VFLGDIKGTKAGLASSDYEALEERIDALHEAFASAFLAFSAKSRSMWAVTFSDSVFAWWTDVGEGLRYGADFMWEVSQRFGQVSFRGFLDSGQVVPESSSVAFAAGNANPRFIRTMPVSQAVWSVSVAEGGHFPDGLYVSTRLVSECGPLECGSEVYSADGFEYVRLLARSDGSPS
jgi:hypothetical protein